MNTNEKLNDILNKIRMEENKKVESEAVNKIMKDTLFYAYKETDSIEVYWLKVIINQSDITRTVLKNTFINKKYTNNFNNLLNSLNNATIERNTLNIWCDLLSLEVTLPFKLPEHIKESVNGSSK